MKDFDIGANAKLYEYNMADRSTVYCVYDYDYRGFRNVNKCFAPNERLDQGWNVFYKVNNDLYINEDMVCTSSVMPKRVIVEAEVPDILDNLTEIIRSHKSKWEKFLWILN